MGETFVFNVAEEVLKKLGSFALQEVCLAWGVESELDKLKSSLSAIKSVLLDAEQKQAKNHQLRDWLGKLKDALYDADDVLDEFHYEALRSQVPNRGGIKGENEYLIVNCCTKNISKSIRHVSSKEGVPRNLLELDNLRTIMIQSKAVGPTFVKTCIERFSYLRMLNLSTLNFEVLPASIGNLKLLRYLDLSLNKSIKKLPNSICKLRNLQFLHLYGCMELEGLPKNIGNLISLRALLLTTKQEILSKEGIGRLKSLRFLWLAGCQNLKSLAEGMQHLSALRTLIIWECESLEESLPHIMRNLTALQNLCIFDCEKLILESKEDMQSVTLSLRSLTFQSISQLVTLPQWIQGAASNLQQLRIRYCRNLVELPEWLQNLTSLQKLEIYDCPELCALPEGMHRLTALRELKIEDCPDLSRRCQRESGEDWPKIAHVPNITPDPIHRRNK